MNNWNQSTMRNDDRNDDKPPYSRIFVVCNKQLRVEDLKPAFEVFGQIEDIHMPRDRNTGESKGIAYIKYTKTSSAAMAIKEMHLKTIQNSNKPIRVMVATHKNDNHNTNEDKYKRLFIKVHKEITESELRQHFSAFGHVESVHLQRDKLTDECRGFAYVNYNTFLDAARAFEECDRKYKAIFATPKEELKRREIISVKPNDNPLSKAANNLSTIVNSFKNAMDSANPDLVQLAEAIAQASTLIKEATSGPRELKLESSQSDFCSVSLPPPQPLANINSRVAQRCFLVFKPHPPPVSILKDAFCRFGDLIDVSTFPNKTFGFAKYASIRAAQEAIKTLHGATLCDIRLKVLEADERPSKEDKNNVDDENGIDQYTDPQADDTTQIISTDRSDAAVLVPVLPALSPVLVALTQGFLGVNQLEQKYGVRESYINAFMEMEHRVI
ncbi:hypothetical protein SFRURICE_004928 [Spodoptera frugiperda]|nr:hypothetical protein SFRURICE_004928 [Spodoptera frugiperda]